MTSPAWVSNPVRSRWSRGRPVASDVRWPPSWPAAGSAVLAWDIDAERLETLALELASAKGTVTCRRVDTSDDTEIDAAWQDVTGMEIQYLVNNAGPPSTTRMSVSDGVRQAIGGDAAMTEAFLSAHAAEATSVVFTASMAGNLRVDATPDWYPAAKAGVVGYSRHCGEARGRPRATRSPPAAPSQSAPPPPLAPRPAIR